MHAISGVKPNPRAPPKPGASRGRSTGRTPPGSRDRTPSPSGARRERPNPKTGTCWECNESGHARQNCPEFKKVCQDNGGKPPAGYKGKYEQLPTGGAKPANLKATLPIPGNDAEIRSDATSDSEAGDDAIRNMFAFPRITCRPRPAPRESPPKLCGTFSALCGGCDDSECGNDVDDEAAMVAALETICHKVTKKSEQTSQKGKKKANKPRVVAPLTKARLSSSPAMQTTGMPTPDEASIHARGRTVLESLYDVMQFLKSDACPPGLLANR